MNCILSMGDYGWSMNFDTPILPVLIIVVVVVISLSLSLSLSVISPHFLSFSLYTQMALRASIPPVLYSAQSLVLGPL